MSKKKLMQILKNLCNYANWQIIRPSLYISGDEELIIVDVYEKTAGSVYHVYIDAKSRYFTYQFLSAFCVCEKYKVALDRFL